RDVEKRCWPPAREKPERVGVPAVRAFEWAAVVADPALVAEELVCREPGDVDLFVEVALDQRRQLAQAPVSRLLFLRRERLSDSLSDQLPAARVDPALLRFGPIGGHTDDNRTTARPHRPPLVPSQNFHRT